MSGRRQGASWSGVFSLGEGSQLTYQSENNLKSVCGDVSTQHQRAPDRKTHLFPTGTYFDGAKPPWRLSSLVLLFFLMKTSSAS